MREMLAQRRTLKALLERKLVYPNPIESEFPCPKCKVKTLCFGDRRYGGGGAEYIHQCPKCHRRFVRQGEQPPIPPLTCPECGATKDIRNAGREIVDGRIVNKYQCWKCGREFKDYYRVDNHGRYDDKRWEKRGTPLPKRLICPECKKGDCLVRNGTRKGQQHYQCRNCGRSFTANTAEFLRTAEEVE